MHRRQSATFRHHVLPALVIVHDLHIVSVPVVPYEADAILIVDPNAVLSTSIACERLEPVAGECRKVTEVVGRMYLLKLPLSNTSDLLQPAAEPAREERLGFGVFERPNHVSTKL